MSEPDKPNQALDLANVADGEVRGSPGKVLRAARESAGIHIAALAGALKIPVSRLEALENDDFAALPDAVFARALASSICRSLDLDPAAVLKLMPKNEVFSFAPASPSLNASFKDGSRKTGRNFLLDYAMRPMGAAVIILLLGVLVLLFVPFGNESPAIADKKVAIAIESPSSDVAVIPEVAVVQITAPTVSDPGAVDEVMSVSSESVVEAGAAAYAPLAPSTPPVPAAAPTELLQFQALGESWVQVRDATKNVVFERTLMKGQTASATGILPLTVVVGRADMTEVLVRGKLFELAGVAKENVARFEVKQ